MSPRTRPTAKEAKTAKCFECRHLGCKKNPVSGRPEPYFSGFYSCNAPLDPGKPKPICVTGRVRGKVRQRAVQPQDGHGCPRFSHWLHGVPK